MTCHDTQNKVLRIIEGCETAAQYQSAKRVADRWLNRLLDAAANDDFLINYAHEVTTALKRHPQRRQV